MTSEVSINGAVVGTIGAELQLFTGYICILIGTILFTSYNSLDHKLDYDPNVKAIRRHMEKQTNNKISYKEAEKIYVELQNNYVKAIQDGKITPTANFKEFVKSIDDHFKKPLTSETIKEMAEQELNAAAECLKNGKIYTKRKEIEHLAKQCGYEVADENNKEGPGIYNTKIIKDKNGTDVEEKTLITRLGNHREINRNTARNIIHILAKGEGNFRQQKRTND